MQGKQFDLISDTGSQVLLDCPNLGKGFTKVLLRKTLYHCVRSNSRNFITLSTSAFFWPSNSGIHSA